MGKADSFGEITEGHVREGEFEGDVVNGLLSGVRQRQCEGMSVIS